MQTIDLVKKIVEALEDKKAEDMKSEYLWVVI